MHIVADENIPFVEKAFSSLGKVTKKPGRQLNADDLKECECLLVRSVTPVNQTLLQNSPVRFVASATIGTDHIDLEYLKTKGIGFANAPGCNAESASEYMINALFQLAEKKGFDPFKLKAGIIGYGNVGSRVKQKLDILGIECLVNDPPLQDKGDTREPYVNLGTILEQCNFITLHVPLTRDGNYPTWHLFDVNRLNQLQPETILFNAARGAVIDNPALSQLLNRRDDLTVYLDCWENEPMINQTLLKQVNLATPHIAGYSYEGKLRGTQMIIEAACDYFKQASEWQMDSHLPELQTIILDESSDTALWNRLFSTHYDVFQDHLRLVALANQNPEDMRREFDLLRKNYPLRYEYSRYRLQAKHLAETTRKKLNKLMFQVVAN